MSLANFIAETSKGLSRSNRYLVDISIPASIQRINEAGGENLRKILLFCDQTQLPGLTLNTTPIKTYGEPTEAPYELNFDSTNFSFYVDRHMVVKYFFDSWIQSIRNPSRNFKYYNEYTTNITISVLDLQDQVPYKVVLYEAYPKTISSVQMGYDQKDVMKLQVSMNFKYWDSVRIGVSDTAPTAMPNLTGISKASGSNQRLQTDPYSAGDTTAEMRGKLNNTTMRDLEERMERERYAVYAEYQNVSTGVTRYDAITSPEYMLRTA